MSDAWMWQDIAATSGGSILDGDYSPPSMDYSQTTEQQRFEGEEEMEGYGVTETGGVAPAAPRLCKAMAQAFPKIGAAVKGNVNPHFKSKYADLASVIDVVKPALTEHGLWFSQFTHPSEKGVRVETVLFHESGEFLSFGELFMPASKHDAQGFGSCLTYAKRYSLMSAFGVPAEDDDGNAAAKPSPVQQVSIPAGLLEAAKNAAMEGSETFRAYWAKLSKEARDQLRPHIGTLETAAKNADKVAA